MKTDEIEMMSTIYEEAPTWYALLNPVGVYFGQAHAFRFVEPVDDLDSKAGAIEYEENNKFTWMYKNEDDDYFLNMTGDRYGW